LTLCASPSAFRFVLSIVAVEGDDGSGVCVEANAGPSQAVARRGPRDTKHGASETRPHKFDELWPRRLALVREIVDVPATKIHGPVFQRELTNFIPC
jgi:hypothetical protein